MEKWLMRKTEDLSENQALEDTAALAMTWLSTPMNMLTTTPSSSKKMSPMLKRKCEANVSSIKTRKYDPAYLQYGFVFTFLENETRPRPLCVICFEKLANSSMKPSHLLRHLHSRHPEYENESVDFFQRRALQQKHEAQVMHEQTKESENEKLLQASFEVGTCKPLAFTDSDCKGMDRWKGRVALVTGASAGIGAAICKQLVAAGMVVVGAARVVERVQALAKQLQDQPGTLAPVKCDMTKDADVAKLFSFIKKEYKGVDVCINNAGMSHNHSLLDGTPEEWREMLDINVVALCMCTKESVKSMQERGVDDGHIIHVNSMSGHRVTSNSSTHFYTATKHAVTGLTEGLRQELRALNSHIRISAISPGIVETEFAPRMAKNEAAGNAFYGQLKCLQPEDIADSIIHMLSAPPHVQIHDILIRSVEQSS